MVAAFAAADKPDVARARVPTRRSRSGRPPGLSLAPRPLYPAYGFRPTLWGLTPVEDQQLAGLIMWVPIGPAYLALTLWLVWSVIGDAKAGREISR